jgi:hypothetical protein
VTGAGVEGVGAAAGVDGVEGVGAAAGAAGVEGVGGAGAWLAGAGLLLAG